MSRTKDEQREFERERKADYRERLAREKKLLSRIKVLSAKSEDGTVSLQDILDPDGVLFDLWSLEKKNLVDAVGDDYTNEGLMLVLDYHDACAATMGYRLRERL